MNNAGNIVVFRGTQGELEQGVETTPVFASNLKRSSYLGPLLGSLDFFIPTPAPLHLHCLWRRDERGRERIVLPRAKVETPSGAVHLKSLARWHTAAADDWFQRASLAALRQLIGSTRG
jgi:hypothetical protein